MDGSRGLYVSEAFHKAFIDVNEEGSEAAAATAVAANYGCRSMAMIMTFVVDRPFLFWLRHNQTQSVLFLGKLCRPEISEAN